MAKKDKSVLKGYFETGKVPTESNFEDLIDSMVNGGDVDQVVPENPSESKVPSTAAMKEYVDGTVENMEREVKEELAGVENDVSKLESIIHNEENPEFAKVEIDSEGKILSSIDKDGNKKENLPTEFTDTLKVQGRDVLSEIDSKQDNISDLEEIRSNANSALQEHQDISLLATKEEVYDANNKIDKNINLNPNAKSEHEQIYPKEVFEILKDSDYVYVVCDKYNRILEAYKKDGTKVFFNRLEDNEGRTLIDAVVADSLSCIDLKSDFVELHLDSKDRILYGIKTNGDVYFGYGVPTQIRKEINNAIVEERTSQNPIEGVFGFTYFPDTLELSHLRSLKKFRCIFNDTFARLDYIPTDPSTGEPYENYTIANSTTLGKNSYTGSVGNKYTEIFSENATFNVGVKEQNYQSEENGVVVTKTTRVAFNSIAIGESSIKMFTTDTKMNDYRITFKMGYEGKPAKVVFRVLNLNEYYLAVLTESGLFVYMVENGNPEMIKSVSTFGAKQCSILIDKDTAYICFDGAIKDSMLLGKYAGVTNCGLYFDSDEESQIDLFVVDYIDSYKDKGMDLYIENDNIGGFNYEAENGLITTSTKHVKESRKSLRFELEYYENWEAHKVAGSRRTEIHPPFDKAAPLDTWISSFDVYFPGLEDGDEYYETDNLDELFWQSHDRGGGYGLSPHVALFLKNDVVRFNTISREILRWDKEDLSIKGQNIAKLVDTLSPHQEIIELEKGKWHNFTIFVKEGYCDALDPHVVVYVDGKKVLHWINPNAYNCGENGEYLKMGIYKWLWADSSINPIVRKRILYYDNILYLR